MRTKRECICPICNKPFTTATNRTNPKCSNVCREKERVLSIPESMCQACGKNKRVDGRVRCRPCLDRSSAAQRRYTNSVLGPPKPCRECKQVKGLGEFVSRRDTHGGITDWCKQCFKILSENGMGYCGKCDAWKLLSEFHNTSWSASRTRTVCINCTTASNYGMTGHDYTALGEAQGWSCALCGATEGRGGRRLHVDHCHATGTVRGFLCDDCNRGLGMLKDSPDLCERAAEYLRNPPALLYLGRKTAPVEREHDPEEELN